MESQIYFWNFNENIVIVDVDGTVTRSDVLGHVLPRIGVSYWAHEDVASLMTNIAANGYKILYLTCRNIGYAWKTKEYVLSIKQEQKFSMPDGPLVLSPNRLWKQLIDEVVVKKPEVFKIACMKSIQRLFPQEQNPFYSGFGNRPSDFYSYNQVGIPASKCYIINTWGEIDSLQKSYKQINELVNEIFPPLGKKATHNELFNDFNFWKFESK